MTDKPAIREQLEGCLSRASSTSQTKETDMNYGIRPATSRIIFKNAHYTACAMEDGSLVVTRNRAKGGVRLVGETAVIWIEHIETAIDSKEASALCKAVVIGG